MNYHTGVYWNQGAVRDINQDSLVALQALTSRGRVFLAAVCDGMGGLGLGEYASGYLIEELVTWFYGSFLEAVGRKKPLWVIRRSLERKVFQVQNRMGVYAEKKNVAMGTTMSTLLLWEKNYMLWHLGDSRIYRFTGKGKRRRFRLLTNDHVQGRNRLTKCVGSFGFFKPDFQMGVLKRGEAFLLCSDGFWHTLEEKELEETLVPAGMSEEKSEKRLKELGKAAMRRGEKDNLSAVYVWTE